MRRSQVDGVPMGWETAGSGPAVVLIHGISECWDVWEPQLRTLGAAGFTAIALDVRGFGSSGCGRGDGTIDQLARDVVSLLEAPDGPVTGGRPVAVVGFSMGGVIAQKIALDHPEHVGAIVIASSSSSLSRTGADWFRHRLWVADLEGIPALARLNAADGERLATALPEEAGRRYTELRRYGFADGSGYRNAARAMLTLREAPLIPRLGEIGVPTLVLTGERDEMCPPGAAERISGRIRDSELVIIEGVGHLAHWEAPDRFDEAVRGFLRAAL